ncbi:DNA-binding transcriptional regulator Fis [Halomonas sp. SH5A2]|uniref:DNA-binding transcriptional regulator Fis n=1 Tax=Halomonas sp. SH5A2 TaxID=2749040 RepID=UPI0016408028|nr:DNA-binding transcriptional regulator Fis [Halomonas sp. SH5A2]QNI02881.1 DNA-binding transcriptional regulator Fis [Halomonas sp. SH5A2]
MTERDLDLVSSDSASDSHTRLNGTLADSEASMPPQPLREAVEAAMRRYFEHLDGSQASDLYAMVMAEVEAPLLACVLEHTEGNQTRAADVLGLNRGTLRKKLKLYGLIEGDAP